MARQVDGVRPARSGPLRGDRAKDEVYRQMFLLEERRPGAEIGLALALLRTWQAVASNTTRNGERDWLKKVSPLCVDMIEAALRGPGAAHSSTH